MVDAGRRSTRAAGVKTMAKKLKESKVERVSAATSSKAVFAPAAAAKQERETLDDRQMLLIAKAIADPRRMSLLRAIAQKTSACADLRSGLSISAATLSHHMKELETAGLISTSKDGRFLHATLQKRTWKSYVSALKTLAD